MTQGEADKTALELLKVSLAGRQTLADGKGAATGVWIGNVYNALVKTLMEGFGK